MKKNTTDDRFVLGIERSILDAIINTIQEGISIQDPNYTILSANSVLNNYYEQKLPLVNKKCYEVFYERSSCCENCKVKKALETGIPETMEIPSLNRNKGKSTLEIVLYPVFDESGQGIGIIRYSKDITKSRQLETNLRDTEERNKALLKAIPDLMFIIDKDGDIIDYNYQSPQNLLLKPEEFLNKNISDVLPQQLAQTTFEALERLFLTGEPQQYEYELKIGENLKEFESRVVLCGENKSLSIVRDITERKKSEFEINESRERAFRQRIAVTQLVLEEEILLGGINQAINKIVEIISDAVAVNRTSVWLLTNNGKELKCISLFEAQDRLHSRGQILNTVDFPDYFSAIKSESRINTQDAQSDSRTSGLSKDYLIPLGITSMLDAGIIIKGEVAGVLCLEHIGDKREWYPDEESFVSSAASIIAQVFTDAKRKQTEQALKKTKIELERYFNSSLDLLCIANSEGKFIRLNPEWENVLGYPVSGLEGQMMLDFVHSDDYEKTLNALARLKGAAAAVSFTNRCRCHNGQFRWIEWRATPQGNLIYAAARDISARIKAEEALSYQLQVEKIISDISSTFATLPLGRIDDGINYALEKVSRFFDTDRSFLFQSFSEKGRVSNTHEWCKPGVLSVKDQIQNITASDYPWIRNRLNNSEAIIINDIEEIPEAAAPEKRLLLKYSVQSLIIVPIISVNKLLGFLGVELFQKRELWREDQISLLKVVAEIISATISKQRSEQTLSFERSQVISIFDSINEIIYVSDPLTYEILYINPTMRRNFTYDPVGGVCYRELQNRETPCEFCTNRIILENKGKPYQWEYNNQSINRTFLITDKIISWPDGRDVRFELAIDITDRKQAEEEREKLQAHLFQSQKMESIGRLAGGVAHDFNNMLAIIMGHTDMALEQIETQHSLSAVFREIRKAAQQSAVLTQQLLAFAHRQAITLNELNLNETIEDMINMLERLIGENIEIIWKPGEDLWLIKGDNTQINQILTNLCVNARDAISNIGQIVIETRNVVFDDTYCTEHPDFLPGEYVRLSIADNGCGISEENLKMVFEPFFTTKEVGQGTGLGLATVYGIVKQNKGFINVKSELNEGTSFSIYLPRHQGREERKFSNISQETAISGTETILIVEDEPSANEIISLMLKKFGYTVISAVKPNQALKLAKEHSGDIQLVLTDVVMPEMNGVALADKLQESYPELKILFMSGYSADTIARYSERKEDVHFINKPFSMKELTIKVREALDN
jgi:PAS domain S-box-containing protein